MDIRHTAQAVKVMEAYAAGSEIQYRARLPEDAPWRDYGLQGTHGFWDWCTYDYRAKFGLDDPHEFQVVQYEDETYEFWPTRWDEFLVGIGPKWKRPKFIRRHFVVKEVIDGR